MKQFVTGVIFLCLTLNFLFVPSTASAAPTCDTFTVSPNRAEPGDFVTLSWTTTDAATVTFSPVGLVATSGTLVYQVPNTPGPVILGLALFDGNVSEPTYEFCEVDLDIIAAPTCDVFIATPNTLTAPNTITLDWETTNADVSVTIDNGIGAVPEEGTLGVLVSSNTTYTLTAIGTLGSTQCTVPVTVTSTGTSRQSASATRVSPRCELTIDQSSVVAGETVIVSWQTNNAVDIILSAHSNEQISNVVSTTSSVANKTGSIPVIVTRDTLFKMTVSRSGQSYDCEGAVVARLDTVLNGDIQGATGFLALDALPVTGFNPTPGFFIILNMFLITGIAFVAYVLVLFYQQFARNRFYATQNLYTPLVTRIKNEGNYWRLRVMLWKMITLVLCVISGGAYFF